MKNIFYIVLVTMFLSVGGEAQAQYAYANAGVGYYGGTAPCPYQAERSADPASRLSNLKLEMRQSERRVDKLKDERAELANLEKRFYYNTEKIPLKEDAREMILEVYEGAMQKEFCPSEETAASFVDLKTKVEKETSYNICSANPFPKAKDLCKITGFYDRSEASKNSKSSSWSSSCEKWLKEIERKDKEIANEEKRYADLEKDYEEALEDKYDWDEYVRETGQAPSEGQVCTRCLQAEPKGPSKAQVTTAVVTDVLGALLTRQGYRYISDKNAALGWPTSPLVLGGFYPMATANLYGAYHSGGAGSWGCAQTIGGVNPYGANGIWGMGNPYMMGPGGMGAYNPYAMIGMNPMMNPYGMNPLLGMSAGINLGMNPYGMNPMMGGMFGMNPMMSGMYGMNPMMGGMFGNPMMGGLGINAGFNLGGPFGMNPMMGGMYGMNPMMGGMAGYPMGMNGMFGMNPMMNGMYGMNPMMNGMYGMNPMMGGINGMGGLGMEYQMQMMQMQMQQQQAYYQAQQRAMQNQMVVSQQVYGLQMEYQQLMQRYQQIMQYSMSGGMYFGGSIGGVTPGVTVPGGNITNPPTGSSTGR